jgi:hypothetical protein
MSVPTTARDGQGRFLTGNSGGGRRKGSRNKLDLFQLFGPVVHGEIGCARCSAKYRKKKVSIVRSLPKN